MTPLIRTLAAGLTALLLFSAPVTAAAEPLSASETLSAGETSFAEAIPSAGETSFAEAMPSAGELSFAEEKNTLSEPDARVISSLLDKTEDAFNHATVDWTVTGGEAEAVTSLAEAPYSVFEGSRSLLLIPTADDGVSAPEPLVISRAPEVFDEIGNAAWFVAVVWTPADAEDVSLTLSLTTKSREWTSSVPVASGRWQAVFFDLTDAPTARITSLSLSIAASGRIRALVDCLGASEDPAARRTARYLTPELREEGCGLSETESGSLLVTLSGTAAGLEAEAPIVNDFSGGLGLRVRLINRSSCRSLTLRYTTLTSSEYSDRIGCTAAIPEGNGVVSCLFPIPESYVGRFRIDFDGAPTGQIVLLSASVSPCFTTPASLGTVTGCVVNRDGTSFSVQGRLPDENAERFAGATVCLYELSLREELSSISTAREALAEMPLNGPDFVFTLPLSEDRAELFRKYAVMLYYAGGLIPVGQAVSITNPERLSDEAERIAPATIKGLWPLEGDYLFDGVGLTAVEVRLDRLLTLGASSVTATVGAEVWHMNAAYVTELDRLLSEYETAGVGFYLVLRVSPSDDISLNGLLCHPASSGGTYAAFNTATDEGINALRAAATFLTARYGTAAGVSDGLIGFVVGTGVNDAFRNYNLGYTGLAGFSGSYAAAFRIVYNAAKAIAGDVACYIPIEGPWYAGMTSGQTGSFDARSALEAISACLAAGGAVDWRVSADVFPRRGEYAWEEEAPDLTTEAAFVTAANLEVLTGALSSAPLSDGTARRLLILENEPFVPEDDNEKIRLSADYVYLRLRLGARRFASVEGLIPAHAVDYNGVFAYLDTNRFSEVSAFAAELIGEERFRGLLTDASSIIERYVDLGDAVTVVPSAVKGETMLFNFSGSADGWRPSLHCVSLRGGMTGEGQERLLSLRFEETGADVWRGAAVAFSTALDLSVAPYLGFTARCAVLPEDVKTLELAVVVTSGKSRKIATLTLPADETTTVVADLSSFPGRSACDGMAIYIRSADGRPIGEPTLLIGSVRAMSTVYTGPELATVIRTETETEALLPTVPLAAVLTVGGVGAVALIWETGRFLRRRKARSD